MSNVNLIIYARLAVLIEYGEENDLFASDFERIVGKQY